MGTSSDISNLFKLIGGRSDQYQEISEEQEGRASLERWPSMAKVELRDPAASVAVTPPNDGAAAAYSGLFETADAANPVSARSMPEEEAAAHSAVPVTLISSFDWAGESLQSMLSKLARTEPEECVDIEPVQTPRPRPKLANIKVVAVVSAKGGVGKSTVAANLGIALQRQGRAVLGIDLDPQNALRHHLGITFEPGAAMQSAGIAQFSGTESGLRDSCQSSSVGVCILPYGSVDERQRRAFECQLESEPDWLAQRLSELQLADGALVVLDTPPGPSVYLQQALAVANLALVVSLSDAASYTTLPMIDSLIQTYAAERTDFIGAAYLINQVDRSRQLSKDITLIMRNILGERMIGVIHRDQSIAEALAYNRSVLDYDPSGQGCHDILACAQAVFAKLTSTERREQPA